MGVNLGKEDNPSRTRDLRIKLEGFLSDSLKNGLAHSWDSDLKAWIKPYPEVTGYLLSYFSSKSILKLDLTSSVDRLRSIQNENGSWPSFYGDQRLGYTFDTTQILHGLLSLSDFEAWDIEPTIERAISFLISRFRGNFPYATSSDIPFIRKKISLSNWAYDFTPINFKMSELLEFSNLQNFRGGDKLIKKILGMKKVVSKIPQIQESHPGGYQLEGILALGDKNVVHRRLSKYFLPNSYGQVVAHPNSNFSYNSGSAQIGILWAKCGDIDIAQSICDYLLTQVESWRDDMRTLPQYSGINPPHREYSTWGIKYLCELLLILDQQNV